MLRARLAVAAVWLPLLAALIAAPEPFFNVVVALVLAAAAGELMRAAAPQGGRTAAITAAAAAALIAVAARSTQALPLWSLLPALALALWLLLRPGGVPRSAAGGWWVLAVLYAGVLGGHWLLLRNVPADAQRWVAVAFAGTFATDTAAYAIGRWLGRRPMAPKISPGKTWEGTAGGVAGGAAGVLAAIALLRVGPPPALAALAAATLPVAAIAGDLLESALKRRIGVKDMSGLLPGHGGLLDRLDSLLFTGPALYWLVRWLGT
ncbi:MAG: phosphatidate cytidylyltransferase [Dehalococcoidia bacterium]|nr:phosphatidate cytidylyltransferase [Dehalococcoidia bacterium]